jgi:hypothetical protein
MKSAKTIFKKLKFSEGITRTSEVRSGGPFLSGPGAFGNT